VAVADSQADHHSPAGTTAEAAEGSNLAQVALMTNSLISDTGAITTSRESRTLRGIVLLLLLLLLLTVIIFVGHEDNGEVRRGKAREGSDAE
jgi:hypothetical protein